VFNNYRADFGTEMIKILKGKEKDHHRFEARESSGNTLKHENYA
jgi:hypothetical protein